MHEQVAVGLHMLSLGQVRPVADVEVSVLWGMTLHRRGGDGEMFIPTTVGDIYGTAPMQDSDAPVHGPAVHAASLTVQSDRPVFLDSLPFAGEAFDVPP